MTTEQSLEIIQSAIEQFQLELRLKETDMLCVFYVDGEIKSIVYNSINKTLAEPFPDNIDSNKLFLIPHFNEKIIEIKIE